MRVTEAWAELGLAPTADARAVRLAYSRRLKAIDVDANPAAFIRLREAYDLTLDWGDQIPEWEIDQPDDAWDGAAVEMADAGGEATDPPPGEGEPDAPYYDWRPQLPNSGTSEIYTLCSELDELLFADSVPDAERIFEAGERLLETCRHVSVDDAVRAEHWLLSALAAAIPRSDPLIQPAMEQFGWGAAVRPRDYLSSIDLDDLLRRLDDRAVLDRLLRHYGDDRDAVKELRTPGRARLRLTELGLAAKVERFLKGTLVSHPTIEHDLDAETVAWWRSYLGRWHLPSSFWLQILTIPPLLTFVISIVLAANRLSSPVSLPVGLLIAFLATLLGILGGAQLRAIAARRDRQFEVDGYDDRRALPWVAAGFALVPGAALSPANWWTIGAWNLAALAVALGVLMTTRAPQPDHGSDSMLGPPSLSALTIFAAATMLFALPPMVGGLLVGPLAALCFVAYRGHEAVAFAIQNARADRTRWLAGAGAAFSAVAGAVLIAYIPALPQAPLLALVPLAAGAVHLLAPTAFVPPSLEWAVRVAVAIFYFMASQTLFEDRGSSLLTSLLLYAVAYSLVRAGLALRQGSGTARSPAF